jgi:hypothetical protein
MLVIADLESFDPVKLQAVGIPTRRSLPDIHFGAMVHVVHWGPSPVWNGLSSGAASLMLAGIDGLRPGHLPIVRSASCQRATFDYWSAGRPKSCHVICLPRLTRRHRALDAVQEEIATCAQSLQGLRFRIIASSRRGECASRPVLQIIKTSIQ